ncbi:hypothetical protein ACWDUL_20515 [Nocardia niigatensis]
MRSVRDWWTRRHDEAMLGCAIAMRDEPLGQHMWDQHVASSSRWQRAGVTWDNAEQCLAESRSGVRYSADGHKIPPSRYDQLINRVKTPIEAWQRKHLILSLARSAERDGDTDAAAALHNLVRHH